MASKAANAEQIARYADMFTALGSESRLRVVRLLLAAHPGGLTVGEIQDDLNISASNLSHHLDKLRNEGLIQFTREGTFLRYAARLDALEELLKFLYAECCTRNKAIEPFKIVSIQQASGGSK
ncbi:MAG: metalloregulator ArsR/SmtB family transcription factor [Acidobacteriota bacterium]|nr:metalloregulator ArsR/SmtB family transcription factor [Acidobacteriota bacterium]